MAQARMTALVLIFCMGTIGAAPVGLAETSQPPLGKRKYVIEGSQDAAPVAIAPDSRPVKGRYLRDPVGVGEALEAPPPEKPKRQKKKKKPRFRETKLSFRALSVDGKLAEPRAEFEKRRLPVGAADESIQKSFFDNIFEPAKRRDF